MSVSVATIASVAAIIYPIAESIIKEQNSKKVAKLRKMLDLKLNKYNVEIDQLKNELERRGLRYQNLVDKLSFVSPVGSAKQARDEAEKTYMKDVDTINTAIKDKTNEMNKIAALDNEKINRLEGKGVVDTIFGIK